MHDFRGIRGVRCKLIKKKKRGEQSSEWDTVVKKPAMFRLFYNKRVVSREKLS